MNIKDVIYNIKKNTNNSNNIIFKNINIKNKVIHLIYSEILTSSSDINNTILEYFYRLIINNIDISFELLYNSIPNNNIKEISTYKEIISDINNGFVIIEIDNKYLSLEVKNKLDRGINKVENELSITGPKDSFTENYNTNIGLIRRRIKSSDLWIDNVNIGRYTDTKIGILYINNIADLSKLELIKNKLNSINIDGIIDSGYLKNMIFNDSKIFPTVEATERPDLVSMALLEGKYVILVDNSPYALILPSFFIDFFHTPDDYYQKNMNISFIRIIRLLAFIIAIFLPAYYISITTHNPDSISVDMLLNFIEQRKNVPFPSLVEALLMTISFEILRESDMRMASTIGSAISILGGLILGDALVSAGIISPIMIIVVATSSISGFVFSSIELTNAIRFYRIFLMVLASIFGIFGIYIGLVVLIINLCSIKSLGYDYTNPFSPLLRSEQKDALLKLNGKGNKYRNPTIASRNLKRGEIK